MAGPAEHCAADTEAQALFCCTQRVLAMDLDDNQPTKIDAGLQPPMWVVQIGAMSATRSPTAVGRASVGQTRASSPRPGRALKISVRAASGQPSRAVSIERGVADWLSAGVVDMGLCPRHTRRLSSGSRAQRHWWPPYPCCMRVGADGVLPCSVSRTCSCARTLKRSACRIEFIDSSRRI